MICATGISIHWQCTYFVVVLDIVRRFVYTVLASKTVDLNRILMDGNNEIIIQ